MSTEDMSMKVNLASIGGRNEWFLIAGLIVPWRIRVISTVLNTNKLEWMIRVAKPPESQLDRIRREIRLEQDSDSRLDQDFVAPALYHIPIEVVSVRVREHQHQERTAAGVVSRTEQVEREWMKKFEGGRSGTKWNCATEYERQRWRDDLTKQKRVWANIHNWGTNPVIFLRKNDLSLEFWRGDCHFVRDSFNFKPAINKNSPRLIRERERMHIHSKTNGRNHWISDRTG